MPKNARKGQFQPRKEESGTRYPTEQKQAEFDPFGSEEAQNTNNMATEHASYSILYKKSKDPDKYGRVPKGWRGFDEITEDRAAVILGDNIDDVATSLVYDDTKGDEGDIDYGVISFSKDLDYEKPYYIEGDDTLYGDDPEEILAQWISTCCILLEEDGCVICDTERNPDCDPFNPDPEIYNLDEQ